MGRDGLKTLESRHMMTTLLYLLDHEKSSKMEIYNGVSRNPRMPEKLMELSGLGLITIGENDNVSEIALTDLGRDVAEHVRSIDEALTPDV